MLSDFGNQRKEVLPPSKAWPQTLTQEVPEGIFDPYFQCVHFFLMVD